MRYTPCVARAILSFGADARRPNAALLVAKVQGCQSKFEAKINRFDQTQDCSAVISAADLRAALDGQIVGLAAVLAPPDTLNEILGILGSD